MKEKSGNMMPRKRHDALCFAGMKECAANDASIRISAGTGASAAV